MKKLFFLPIVLMTVSVYAQQSKKAAPAAIQYQEIKDFSEGYACFLSPDNKWGFINDEGKVVIQPAYEQEGYFKFGLLHDAIQFQNAGKILDASGNTVLESKNYYVLNAFTDSNYTTACTWADAANGIISKKFLLNRKGEQVRELTRDENKEGSSDCRQEIHEGRIWNVQQNGKCGYLNLQNELVIPAVYNEAKDFSNNRAWVQKLTGNNELKWGAIDTAGTVKVDFIYSLPQEKFSNSRCFIKKSDDSFILIDENGNSLNDDIYQNHFPYNENYAVGIVNKNDILYYRILDIKGKTIKSFAPPSNPADNQIELTTGFNEGLCIAKKGDNFGAVDVTGKIVIPFSFTELHEFHSGRAFAKKTIKTTGNEVEGFIDHSGNYVIVKAGENN